MSDRKEPSLTQLMYFVEVAKRLSYRSAAQALGISQPTLTNQIAQLEEKLGITLFERSRSGTRLSAQGRALLPSAETVITASRQFTSAAQTLSDETSNTYRLGVPPTLGPYLLPHLLQPLHKRYPTLKFYVREGAPRQLVAGLLNGTFDVLLTPFSQASSQIMSVPLFTEPLKLVLPIDHVLAKDPFIDPAGLGGEKVLSLEDKHHFHHQVQEICTKLGADIDRDYEGTSLDTLRQMVVMGMGIAFLPGLYIHSELHRPDALHVCELKGMPIIRQHALAWRNTSPSRAFFRELAAQIKQIVACQLSSAVSIVE